MALGKKLIFAIGNGSKKTWDLSGTATDKDNRIYIAVEG